MQYTRMVFPVIALIVMLILSGCGNLPGGDGNAQQAVCGALDNVSTAVNQLDGIQAEATVGEVKELTTQVDGAIEKVRIANKALNSETIKEVLASYDSFSASIEGLDDDAAIGDAVTQIKDSIEGVNTALEKAGDVLKCSQ